MSYIIISSFPGFFIIKEHNLIGIRSFRATSLVDGFKQTRSCRAGVLLLTNLAGVALENVFQLRPSKI